MKAVSRQSPKIVPAGNRASSSTGAWLEHIAVIEPSSIGGIFQVFYDFTETIH